MPKIHRGKDMKISSKFYLICCCSLLLFGPICTAQEKVRTLEHSEYRQYDLRTEPFAIVGRGLGSKQFRNDREVIAGPQWLSELTLIVKNVSQKPIVQAEINLKIPKQGKMVNPAVIILRFPSHDTLFSVDRKPTGELPPLKPLKPGEIIQLRVPEHELRILEDIKKDGVVDLDVVSIAFISATFEDGTRWFQGLELREDPDVPGRWSPVRRPVIPRPIMYQLFGTLGSPLGFVDVLGSLLNQCVQTLPAKSRFLFATAGSPLPPEGCGWFDQQFRKLLRPFTW